MKAPTDGASEPKYVDRPEVDEVFADRLEHLSFDGASVRMEFTVVRTEPPQIVRGRPSPPERKRWSYTAARIVLSPLGAAEMLNKMQELQRLLLDHGVVQPTAATAASAPLAPSERSS